MDVIGAGFGRTGTLSLKAALEQLGYGPCLHMFDVVGNPGWIAAWQAVLDGCETNWGELLGGFRSAVDWPATAYYAELAAAFPAAKVVLTVRPAEAWYESVRNTLYAAFQAQAAGELKTGELPQASPEFMRLIRELLWERTFGGRFGDRDHAIGVYQAHIARVRKTVPAERLLVFHISEGWQPLARFLGAPVPRAPFPRLNDSATVRRQVGLPPQ
jgi:Sulfotransferase domain